MEQHAAGPQPAIDEAAAWEKLHRLAEKQRVSDDPDISRALEAALVAEAQALSATASAKPAWLKDFPLIAGFFQKLSGPADSSPEPVSPDPVASQTQILSEEPLPNDVEKAERLIREANLYTIRSDKAKAKQLLDEAEAAAPRAPTVLVALGDAALERHNVKEAVRLYGLAKDADPGNVVYERKHADAVFRQTQGMIFDPSAKPGALTDAASAKGAVVLSFMLPGLGQIVTGETVKGIAFLGCWLGAWIVAFVIGFEGLWSLLGMQGSKGGSIAVLAPLALALLLHLGAILDASAKAKTGERRTVMRPVPPAEGGNKPFE